MADRAGSARHLRAAAAAGAAEHAGEELHEARDEAADETCKTMCGVSYGRSPCAHEADDVPRTAERRALYDWVVSIDVEAIEGQRS